MCRADNLTTFICRLSGDLGASTSWYPQGLSTHVMGLVYLYLRYLAQSYGRYVLPFIQGMKFYLRLDAVSLLVRSAVSIWIKFPSFRKFALFKSQANLLCIYDAECSAYLIPEDGSYNKSPGSCRISMRQHNRAHRHDKEGIMHFWVPNVTCLL